MARVLGRVLVVALIATYCAPNNALFFPETDHSLPGWNGEASTTFGQVRQVAHSCAHDGSSGSCAQQPGPATFMSECDAKFASAMIAIT
jgi:hypothetical protein